jgi:acyl carrier protein
MSEEPRSRAEILERVQSIAASVLNLPDLELGEDTTAHEVPGWDSLTHVQIIVGVEQAFGIRMTSTEVAQLENAGSLVDVIQTHRMRAAGA